MPINNMSDLVKGIKYFRKYTEKHGPLDAVILYGHIESWTLSPLSIL